MALVGQRCSWPGIPTHKQQGRVFVTPPGMPPLWAGPRAPRSRKNYIRFSTVFPGYRRLLIPRYRFLSLYFIFVPPLVLKGFPYNPQIFKYLK